MILSKKRAQYERACGTIEKIKEEDGVVEGLVIEVVKGGLIVDIGLRGFLPASLVEMRRVRDLSHTLARHSRQKSLNSTKIAITSFFPAARTWKRPRAWSAKPS